MINTKSNHWMTILFMTIVGLAPWLKPKLWQWLYNKIASIDISGNFQFMNYGYLDPHTKQLQLEELDEKHRYAIQLYDYVIHSLETKNKDILEVGCGRGGGGSYILRYKDPNSYLGIDISKKAISWCQKHHMFPCAKWVQGSADSIPALNESTDIVVNIESSHCYPSMKKFLQEVNRILRPNGYLALCDLRPKASIRSLEDTVHQSGLKIVIYNVITSQVIKALDSFSSRRHDQIASTFNPAFHDVINNFAAIKNTSVYNKLVKGDLVYFNYVLQKDATSDPDTIIL